MSESTFNGDLINIAVVNSPLSGEHYTDELMTFMNAMNRLKLVSGIQR